MLSCEYIISGFTRHSSLPIFARLSSAHLCESIQRHAQPVRILAIVVRKPRCGQVESITNETCDESMAKGRVFILRQNHHAEDRAKDDAVASHRQNRHVEDHVKDHVEADAEVVSATYGSLAS